MITETVLQQVKNSEDTKLILKNRMKDFTELNTGTKAELAKKLLCDVAVYEEAVQIMGEGLNEAEIEIECLETKNKELEKELNMSDEDKERLNKLYYNKKVELQNDGLNNKRVMKRLNNIMCRSKQLTEKQ